LLRQNYSISGKDKSSEFHIRYYILILFILSAMLKKEHYKTKSLYIRPLMPAIPEVQNIFDLGITVFVS